MPAALTARFEDLVLVVGEANAWPYYANATSQPEELVHWVAHRPATGETLSEIAAPERPLSPSTTFHTEIAEAELLAAPPRAELLAALARFLRPSDVVCAWGHYSFQLIGAAGFALPAERLDLRTHSHALLHRKIGSLEAYAASLGAPPAPLAPGRAGRRAAMLVQIVEAWRALAEQSNQ